MTGYKLTQRRSAFISLQDDSIRAKGYRVSGCTSQPTMGQVFNFLPYTQYDGRVVHSTQYNHVARKIVCNFVRKKYFMFCELYIDLDEWWIEQGMLRYTSTRTTGE